MTDDAATKLYGTAAPTEAPGDPGANDPAQAAAETLYGGSKAEAIPHAHTLRPTFQHRDSDLAEVVGLDRAVREEAQQAFLGLINQAGLDPYVVAPRLYNLLADAALAEVRGSDAIDDAQIQQWEEDTRQQLRSTYGEEFEGLLERAAKYINQFPDLAELMEVRGIGSRPEIVIPIVELVRRINFR